MQVNKEILDRLGNILKSEFQQIAFAHLFGSAATGKLKTGSDIDIAIFLKPAEKTLELISAIIGVVEEIIPGFPCDLLILNDAGKMIAMEALKGKVIFVRESELDDYAEFYSLTCRLYEDQIYWMKKQLLYRGYEVQWNN